MARPVEVVMIWPVLHWAAVKELNLSYYTGEIPLFTFIYYVYIYVYVYAHRGSLI